MKISVFYEHILEAAKQPEIQKIITNAVHFVRPVNHLETPYECKRVDW